MSFVNWLKSKASHGTSKNLSITWNMIVAEHGRMVVQTAMRVLGNAADAEDVAQEVFLELVSRPPTADVRNWGAYLRRLAVFRALDRRRQRRHESPLALDTLAKAGQSPHDEAVQRELAEHLRTVIAALPEREGAVFALRYFEQLSNPQIAEVLEISVGAVAAAVHKVRVKLDSILSNSLQGEQ
ncbi:RNA polymerase sigma factor [Zavarzinella formosa]|uniref:RNA polymerase sigma factor n=1 Tax=Zavarzinella formosa TaxID=360055 RepID=UPI0002F403F1|nr:sigma-70 family RNA polymerase sigma factor [Zavarzinella formosa]